MLLVVLEHISYENDVHDDAQLILYDVTLERSRVVLERSGLVLAIDILFT